MSSEATSRHALVIGAGFAGMRAALDLADLGVRVTLIDRRCAPGGTLTQLDAQYPTVDCGACQIQESLLGPPWPEQRCLRTGVFHPFVTTLTSTELTAAEKREGGRFQVTLRQAQQWIDAEKCTGCGDCAAICPVNAADEHQAGTCTRKAAYRRHGLTDPPLYVIDEEACNHCGECVPKCPEKAIVLDRPAIEREVNCDAILLATGFDSFDPALQAQWAYGRHPDVVTGLELERLLAPRAAGGPAPLIRRSNGAPVERVAFVQCVGSRDQDRPWCSSICCMHALKEAIMLREQLGVPQCHIYAIDLRCTGKGYEETAARALAAGVVVTHGRPGAVELGGEQNRLQLRVELPGQAQRREEYDMVVLSVGLTPSAGTGALARTLGCEVDEAGFVAAIDPLNPVETTNPGVFVCGAASGPSDIPTSITQASQAALAAAFHMGLPQRDVQQRATSNEKNHSARKARVVPLVHTTGATGGPSTEPVSIIPRALVLGAGPAGLSAARVIGQAGFEVVLVDRASAAGGNLRQARRLLAGPQPKELLAQLLSDVDALDHVELLLGWELVKHSGGPGNYTALLREVEGRAERKIRHGALIVATGCAELEPLNRFGYGEAQERVITQRQLESLLDSEQPFPIARPTVVMIQCVGSREPQRPDCSRVCCHEAIKNALWLSDRAPGAQILILHRDLRTVGFDEIWAEKARQRGVVPIRIDESHPPTIEPAPEGTKGALVQCVDPLLNRTLRVKADFVVLSTGMKPLLTEKQAENLGLSLGRSGFIEEANRKYRTVEATRRGVLAAGAAVAPVLVPEAITQGEAAALRAIARLSRLEIYPRPGAVAYRAKWCAACGLCVDVCPSGARELDEERGAIVHPGLCQGCGGCAAACPSGCTEQPDLDAKGVMALIDAAMEVMP